MFDVIISGYRWLFLQLVSAVGNGWAVVALSFITSALMVPLMRAVAGVVRREAEYQSVILPQLAQIKAKYDTDAERHEHTRRLYERYGYSPLSAVKKVLPLFVQIPFLLLTYYMLKGTPQLSGVSFLFLRDLGAPDALAAGINLLPIVMTLVNVVTVFATPGFTHRDMAQAIGISFLFLVLLYTAPSALLLYWTLNNVITLVRTLFGQRCAGARLLGVRLRMIRNLPRMVAWFADSRVLAMAVMSLILVGMYMVVTAAIYRHFSMGMTWYLCNYGSVFMLAFASIPAYMLMRGEKCVPQALLVAGTLPSLLFAVFFFCINRILVPLDGVLYTTIDSYLDFPVIFWVLLALMVVPLAIAAFSCRRGCVSDIGSVIKADWALLLLPICFGIHYSYASEDFSADALSLFLLCVYLLAPCVVLSTIFVALFRKWLSPLVVSRIVTGAFVGIYLVPMISTESGPLGYNNNFVIRLALAASVAVLLAFIRRRSLVAAFVCLLLGLSGANAVFGRKAPVGDGESSNNPTDVASVLGNVTCVHSNNVYLFIYDSYEHQIVLDALGIDNSAAMESLKAHGFSIYDEAYGPGRGTAENMTEAFTLGGVRGANHRTIMAGDNVFSDFLRKSGYRTHYVLGSYNMPIRGERMPGDTYFPLPQEVKRADLVLYPCIMRGVFAQMSQVFDAYTHEEWVAAKRSMVASMSPSNSFLYAHSSLPAHVNWYPRYRLSDKEEQAKYAERLRKADDELVEDLRMVCERDPDALVIVASDHGGWLLLPEEYGNPDARNLLDHHGILLAVRWPKGYKTHVRINSIANALLETLIYLTADESLRRYESENVSQGLCFPMNADGGRIKNGIMQRGPYAGKTLFEAAAAEFREKPAK